ncbi:hypothetical protein [Ruegeria sp. HKCCD6119]|uniref:hypothetical protein n=1 Tax=Ruegeria sp. HKCCD6119 TaxID=2683003 RepID=UPI001492962F|nr:hypothetical protein [Ruegeria sp. HKCCD6119]NOD85942.1 hypothetical protein [Ruegeria sp. HKCCD6119]
MVSFSSSFKKFGRVATLILACGTQPVTAEILPGTAERITQLSQSFHRLGLPGNFPQASVIATDMLFVLEELERLSGLVDVVGEDLSICGISDGSGGLSLDVLGRQDCLTVLLGAERARWRTAAELSAQVHLLARDSLIESLPLEGLEDLEESARRTARAWWREAGPATLEAYARIGREWIKHVENDVEEERERAKAEILDALDRIALEPGALQLRQVLTQTPVHETLREAFMPLVEEATGPGGQAAKLKAAARFAGALDSLMSRQIRDIYGQDAAATCAALRLRKMTWDDRLPPLGKHCRAAIALLQDVDEGAGVADAEAFQQLLILAFEERILTMRLLLAKLGRVNALEGEISCSGVMGALNASLDDRGRRPLGRQSLDQDLIDQAAGGFARLSAACLANSSATLLSRSCQAGSEAVRAEAVFGRMPPRIAERLRPNWDALVEAADTATLAQFCDDPVGFRNAVAAGKLDPAQAVVEAVEELAATAQDVTLNASISELRPFLDGYELPVQVFSDIVDRLDLLCTEITDILPSDPSDAPDRAEPLTAQMLRATLVDAGILTSEGKRPPELTTLCEVLSRKDRQRDGTPLDVILTSALADVEDTTISADEAAAWAQGVMERLNKDGDRLATRLAAGVAVAKGVDKVRQTLSLTDSADGDRRCNAPGRDEAPQDAPASLAPGIRIADFSSSLDTSGEVWSVGVSATVNLVLCGPIAHGQGGTEGAVGGGQMQRTLSLGPKDDKGEIIPVKAPLALAPIPLDGNAKADEIVEAIVAGARDAAADIEIDEEVLLDALAEYLRVAGISDLNVIRSFEASSATIEWDEGGWVRVRTTIAAPRPDDIGMTVPNVELCLLLPVLAVNDTDEDADCIPIEHLEDRITKILVEQIARPVFDKVLSDLGISVQGAFREAGITPDISIGYARTDGGYAPTVVSRIALKSEDLNALAGVAAADTEPFQDALVINVAIQPDGQYDVTVDPPRLNDSFFLALLPDLAETGFLRLSRLSRLPDGARASQRDRCDPIPANATEPQAGQPAIGVPKEAVRRIYRLALTEEAPLSGVLGYVCAEIGSTPSFVAPQSGELRTPDENWRLVFQTGDKVEFVAKDDEGSNNHLLLELELRVSDPDFRKLDGKSVAVEFDLTTGAWRLPAAARANRVAYAMIEEQLSRQLPQGVRVYGVEFSSDGIKLRLAPPDADDIVAILADGTLSDVDLSGLRDTLNTACEGYAPFVGLARMIETGEAQDEVPGCEGMYDPLVHDMTMRGADISWSCAPISGNSKLLRTCDIVFDDELTICETKLNIEVNWDNARNRAFEDGELIECLEDHVGSIVPEQLGPRIAVGRPGLSPDCLAAPARCRLTTEITADFSDAFDDLDTDQLGLAGLGLEATTCGQLSDDLVATLHAEFGLDGTSRFRFSGAEGDFDAVLDQCAADLSLAVAEAAFRETRADETLDELWDEVSRHGRELLAATSAELTEVTGETVRCELALRDGGTPSCDALSEEMLQSGTLRGAHFVSDFVIFETKVEVRVGFAFELAALTPENFLSGRTQPEEVWKGLRDSAKVTFDLGCKDQTSSECLSGIGHKLAEELPEGFVSYEGGLQIEPGPARTAIKIPLRIRYEDFGLDLPVVVDCGLETPRWNDISLSCAADPDAVILEAVAQGLRALVPLEMDLGLASISVSDPEYKADRGLVIMKAQASFKGLDVLPQGFDEAGGAVTIDRDLRPNIEIEWTELVNGASEHLADAVNGVIGDFLPVEIVKIEIDSTDAKTGIPDKIGIESQANIIEVISLSAPRLVLSESGLEVEGPNRFSIELPDGFSIPVPPIAICPNGGAIEDKELTLKANITIGECTASGILKFAGSVTVFLDRPKVETLGRLVVLTVLPLGHSEGVFDLGKRIISHETEIGGVMSDIIRMRTMFVANGQLMTVKAEGDIDVFKTRVGEGVFDLDLRSGVLNTAFEADIGIAKGQGFVRTEAGFSRPEAEIDGKMGIGGFPVFGTYIKARARFAKVGISIFGLRLAVAFPGLDLLDPSKIADLLKDLLTPNFENLDEALEALLSGNITINPFADFGSGGDGMGDSSDGDAGESAGGDGASDGGEGDPGEGLGNEENPSEAENPAGPPTPVPPEGVLAGGLAGTAPAPLWFEIDETTEFVRIGTGTQGGEDEKVVALAVHDSKHFDTSGTRQGKTLVLLDQGYTQILESAPHAGPPCDIAAQTDRIVVVYAGTDAPRQGMYELCRLRDINGTPVTESFFAQADAETLSDVAALQDALTAELLSRSQLDGHDHRRLLLKARLIASGDPSGLRGAAAFQRPGELLVAMRGKFKESKCGGQAEPDPAGELAHRIYLLKGFRAADLDEPATVLRAVRSVWGCEPGALARFDPKTRELATSSAISREGDNGFDIVAVLPDVETPEEPTSFWAATLVSQVEERREEQQEQEEQDRKSKQLREDVDQSAAQGQLVAPACEVGCTPVTVSFQTDGDGCLLMIGATPYPFAKDGDLFGNDCRPARPEFTWLDLFPTPFAVLAANPEAAPATITLGQFAQNRLDKSGALGFGVVLQKYTFAQHNFLSGLPGLVNPRGATLGQLQSLYHPSGAIAAVLPGTDGRDSYWHILKGDAWFNLGFSGSDLAPDRAAALLPHLAPNTTGAQIRKNGDVLLVTSGAHKLLEWIGDNWQLVFKLDQDRWQARFRDHVLTHVSDTLADPTWTRDGRPVPYNERIGGWGFTAVDRDSGDGELILKRVSAPDYEAALTPLETWGGADRFDEFPEGNRFWFKLDLPEEMTGFRITSVHDTADSVICLFDAGLNRLAGDDDSHTKRHSAQLDYRIDPSRRPAWLRITEYNNDNALPSDLTVELSPLENAETSGHPNEQCDEVSPEKTELDFFGELFVRTTIKGLGAANGDPAMLATLAKGILSDELPSAFDLVAVPMGDGHQKSFVMVREDDAQRILRPDADSLEFMPFLRIEGDQAPNKGTLIRAVSKVLTRFGTTERVLSGQSIEVEGVNAWSVTTAQDGQSRQFLFLEQDENVATVDLRQPNAEPALLARLVDYVVLNGWPSVSDAQVDPLILEVRGEDCATAVGACPRRFVHLEPGEEVAFPEVVIGEEAFGSSIYSRWLEVFSATVATRRDAVFNRDAYEGIKTDTIGAFRFLRDGPIYLVSDAGWACANLTGLTVRSAEMAEVLSSMAGKLDADWQDGPALLCDEPHFSIQAGPAGTPDAVLLTQFAADGRLRMMKVPLRNPAAATVIEPTESLPLPLAMTVRDDFAARTGALGVGAFSGMDLLAETELVDGRDIWVFGDGSVDVGSGNSLAAWSVAFMNPNPLAGTADDEPQLLPCLLTGVSVALPQGAEGNTSVVEAAVESIREALVDADTCHGANGAVINVWQNPDGGYSAFFQEILDFGALEEGPGTADIFVASLTTPRIRADVFRMLDDRRRNLHVAGTKRKIVATFGDQKIKVDYRVMEGLFETEQSDLMRLLVERLDALSKTTLELGFTTLDLVCASDAECETLVGRWSAGASVALQLNAGGRDVRSLAIALNARPAIDAAVALAQRFATPEGAVYEVLTRSERLLAAEVRNGDVWLREDASQGWQKLGVFSRRPPGASAGTIPSVGEASIRDAALRRILKVAQPFEPPEWLVKTGAVSSPAGLAMSFEHRRGPGNLTMWETITARSSVGPIYWRAAGSPLPVALIIAHIETGRLKGGRKGLWLPDKDADEPQLIAPLSATPKQTLSIASLHAVEGAALVPRVTFLPNCEGTPDRLQNLVRGLSRLNGAASATCTSVGGDISLLVSAPRISEGLVAMVSGWQWFDVSDLGQEREANMRAFALAVSGQSPDVDIKLAQREGRVLALAQSARVWWKTAGRDVAELGQFHDVDTREDKHLILLSRVAGMELAQPPQDARIVRTAQVLRADLMPTRTAILGGVGIIDLRTFEPRSAPLPSLPDHFAEEGTVLLRQDGSFPVLFWLDANGAVSGEFFMRDVDQAWQAMGDLAAGMSHTDARTLADMLIYIAKQYGRPPEYLGRTDDGSFTACQDAAHVGNVDVFKSRTGQGVAVVEVENTDCSQLQTDMSPSIGAAFMQLETPACTGSKALLFKIGSRPFLGVQAGTGPTDAGCLFAEEATGDFTLICDRFPLMHPARDQLVVLFQTSMSCDLQALSATHALVENANGGFLAVSRHASRMLRLVDTDPGHVRRNATPLVNWASGLSSNCRSELTVMDLRPATDDTLLEEPCRGLDVLDGNGHQTLVNYVPATGVPLAEEILGEVADLFGELRDLAPLESLPTSEALLIQLRHRDILVLSKDSPVMRHKAPLSASTMLLGKIDGKTDDLTHVLYQKVADPSNGGDAVHVAALFTPAAPLPLNEALDPAEHTIKKTLAWSNGPVQPIKLGFALFESAKMTSVAFEWLKQQTFGQTDLARAWLNQEGLPEFYVIRRGDLLLFRLIDNTQHRPCTRLELTNAQSILEDLSVKPQPIGFSSSWPGSATIGEPGWYAPLSQDPRLALYFSLDAKRC